MPVYVNYKGRTGNKLFQYVSARIFSEKNELNLRTKFPDFDVLNTKEEKFFEGDSDENNLVTVNSSSFFNDEIIFDGKNKKYLFDDYFQNCVYINNNQELVMSFFDLPKFDKNIEDIVLNIRLDDKVHSNNLENPENWDRAEIIHPNYYKKILDSETYKNVYIVVDKIKYDWEKKYMSHFEKYNPILVSGTPFEDFNFIRSFNKIITSVSTFSYWSAFLSNADKIYTFKNAGYLGKNMSSHGNHVKELWNIKNKSIVIDEKLYFGE